MKIVHAAILLSLPLTSVLPVANGADAGDQVVTVGEGGQVKMLYDRRQRPQSLHLNGKVHIVFNGGGERGGTPKFPTHPMIVTYDPSSRTVSDTVTLGPKSKDHHDGPVIWADEEGHIHVLYGCHRTPGTHLVSRRPGLIGTGRSDWREAPQIAPSLSYPTVHRVAHQRALIYYRTAGHISSWTYRISSDNGNTWTGPQLDVTDMDGQGRFEWSSYQCTVPSEDGRFLHVVFTAYDDNRQNDPQRYHNARYGHAVNNGWKYNLYYLRIDLKTHAVTNFEGQTMATPIDIDQADAKCRIWDTEGRGAGVPPDIALDAKGDPAFLHVLSGDSIQEHDYYYVSRARGSWQKTRIAPSNHQWNSGHLHRRGNGAWHAYLVTGEGYLDSGGYMDSYGGGRIEEWVSLNQGKSWKKSRTLPPHGAGYPGWKFNNVQPVTASMGHAVDGMLLFYGWKHKDAPEGRAFLLHDRSR